MNSNYIISSSFSSTAFLRQNIVQVEFTRVKSHLETSPVETV